MSRHRFVTVLSIFPLLSACAAASGTRPADMSAAQHETSAEQEERAASVHEGQHDPKASVAQEHCAKGNVCWTSRSNPTEQHRSDAAKHRELAAKHRAAGAALKQAEATACVGIAEEDRDVSPFYHREDIASVKRLEKDVQIGKQASKRLVGATIVFRAVPGLTAEWLQREVNCHLARAAALGHQMPEMDYCPLVLKDVKATVSSTGDGFAVSIEAEDAERAKQILQRAETLASASH